MLKYHGIWRRRACTTRAQRGMGLGKVSAWMCGDASSPNDSFIEYFMGLFHATVWVQAFTGQPRYACNQCDQQWLVLAKTGFPQRHDACVGWKMVFTRRHTLVERVPAVLSNRRTLSIRMVSFYLTCNPPPRAGKRSTPYRERVHRKHQKANHKPLLLKLALFPLRI